MKKGKVTYQSGEYILQAKKGKYITDIEFYTEWGFDGEFCLQVGAQSILSRTDVLLLSEKETLDILQNMSGQVCPVETKKLVTTYGIEYGESGNYPISPFFKAEKEYAKLKETEKIRFLRLILKDFGQEEMK
ncbi:MAG: hypothetical protein ABF624_07265 [Liquorilactobacillus ghanensis]|uniref:hypothetical protein n=1 Tax=Liquorilactobacillus ghanensis TaxID=399370 RepID=UPI0039E948E2